MIDGLPGSCDQLSVVRRWSTTSVGGLGIKRICKAEDEPRPYPDSLYGITSWSTLMDCQARLVQTFAEYHLGVRVLHCGHGDWNNIDFLALARVIDADIGGEIVLITARERPGASLARCQWESRSLRCQPPDRHLRAGQRSP